MAVDSLSDVAGGVSGRPLAALLAVAVSLLAVFFPGVTREGPARAPA
ncbi:MAG: hypothetical protein JJD97_00940 [Gemmatimonadaceae bacterium]|nr:hypothetical protein [Gemmatimonadaceae bacterium]